LDLVPSQSPVEMAPVKNVGQLAGERDREKDEDAELKN